KYSPTLVWMVSGLPVGCKRSVNTRSERGGIAYATPAGSGAGELPGDQCATSLRFKNPSPNIEGYPSPRAGIRFWIGFLGDKYSVAVRPIPRPSEERLLPSPRDSI